MPSSVVRLVTLDHRRLERLLARATSPGPSRERWRREFLSLLRAHHDAEDRELYPHVDKVLDEPEPTAAARRQAGSLLELGERAERLAVDSRQFTEAATGLRDALAEHVRLTEQALLPRVDQALERRQLRDLGGRYEQHREQELAALGGHRAVPRRLDYSRAELYELARKAGIEGRSAMTREQLIDALMQRSGPLGERD